MRIKEITSMEALELFFYYKRSLQGTTDYHLFSIARPLTGLQILSMRPHKPKWQITEVEQPPRPSERADRVGWTKLPHLIPRGQ